MKDKAKTKEQLIKELRKLSREIEKAKKLKAKFLLAKDELGFGHKQLLSIFDSIDEAIYVVDPNTYKILYANEALRKLFPTVIGRKCYKAFQALEFPCSFCTNKHIFGKNIGKSYVWDHQSRFNNRWYHCIDKAIKWPDGRLVRCEIAIDITERKKAIAALKESEEKFRLVFENVADAIFWADSKSGLIINCNNAAEVILGKKKSEIIGQHQTSLHPPEKSKYYSEMFRKHIEKGEVFEEVAEIITKSGEIKTVFISASTTLIGERLIIQGIFRDVTDRKKVEKRLAESEAQFRSAFENAGIGMAIVALDGRWLKVNNSLCAILGYSQEELLTLSFQEVTHPDDVGIDVSNVKKLLHDKIPYYRSQKRYIHKDGHDIDVLLVVSLIKDAKGVPLRFIFQVQDITDRKQAEEALKDSEQNYRTLLEGINDIVFRLSPAGFIEYISPEVEDLYGYKVEELIGKHLKKTTPLSEIPRALEAIKRTLAGEKIKNFPINQIDKKGNIVHMEVNCVPLEKDGKIIAIQGVMRDVTERKK